MIIGPIVKSDKDYKKHKREEENGTKHKFVFTGVIDGTCSYRVDASVGKIVLCWIDGTRQGKM